MTALVAVMLILTACKKEEALQPQKEEIIITGLPAWGKVANLVVKTETTLSDADYERIKNAIGGVEVKFAIAGEFKALPYSSTNNNLDLVTAFYYKWDEKKLTIYRQNNIPPLLEAPNKPGDLQLVFYVLK